MLARNVVSDPGTRFSYLTTQNRIKEDLKDLIAVKLTYPSVLM